LAHAAPGLAQISIAREHSRVAQSLVAQKDILMDGNARPKSDARDLDSPALSPGNDDSGIDIAANKRDAASMASYLHELGRLKKLHLSDALFANPALDVLLTLYIADQENLTPPVASLSVANHMTANECDTVLDQLVERGLARWHAMNGVSGICIAQITEMARIRLDSLLRRVAAL